MKINLLYFLTFILVLTSCSNDNDSQNEIQNFDPNTILPKKITQDIYSPGFGENSHNIVYEFFYDNSKLSIIEIYGTFVDNGNLIEDERYLYFTYNGNFISKIELKNNLGEVLEYYDYTYLNNKLVERKIFRDNSLLTSYNYIYNSNTITRNYTFNDFNGNPVSVSDNYVLTDNLISRYNADIWSGYDSTDIFYSSSISPFKNIIGLQDALVEGGVDFLDSELSSLFFSTKKNLLNNPFGEFLYTNNDIEFPISVHFFEGGIGSINYDNKTITYHLYYQ